MKDLKIQYLPITDIKPYAKNPRKNDNAVAAVANSLREFGWRQPIVIDASGVIVAGHTRYKAALSLGMDRVPVVRADDLTPEQVKAYRLADNKTNELAAWDIDSMNFELEELAAFNIDMEQFGFTMGYFDGTMLDAEQYNEKTEFKITISFPTYNEYKKSEDKIRDFVKQINGILTVNG